MSRETRSKLKKKKPKPTQPKRSKALKQLLRQVGNLQNKLPGCQIAQDTALVLVLKTFPSSVQLMPRGGRCLSAAGPGCPNPSPKQGFFSPLFYVFFKPLSALLSLQLPGVNPAARLGRQRADESLCSCCCRLRSSGQPCTRCWSGSRKPSSPCAFGERCRTTPRPCRPSSTPTR